MSADNVIYVRGEYDGQVVAWFVWEQSTSVDPKRPESDGVSMLPTKPAALEYAHDLMDGDDFPFGVEYGVRLLESLPATKEESTEQFIEKLITTIEAWSGDIGTAIVLGEGGDPAVCTAYDNVVGYLRCELEERVKR